MSTSTGKLAEDAAAEFVQEKDYKVIARNWRRPSCEIDIIATKKQGFLKPKKVYFIEVKYRKRDEQGSGIEYITPKKLKQMKFSAQIWVSENNYEGEFELGAVEVTGPEYKITMFLPELDI